MAIGTAISAGVGAASAIFGGIKNAREARKQRRLLKEQEAAEKAWYDREYNTDNTQRASAQRLITMTQDSIRKRNQAAAGQSAVMGGTAAAAAAAREQNNNAIAQTASNINAQGMAQRDAIEHQHLANMQNFANRRMQMSQQQQANTAAAIQGVGQAVATAGLAFDEMADAKKDLKQKTDAKV